MAAVPSATSGLGRCRFGAASRTRSSRDGAAPLWRDRLPRRGPRPELAIVSTRWARNRSQATISRLADSLRQTRGFHLDEPRQARTACCSSAPWRRGFPWWRWPAPDPPAWRMRDKDRRWNTRSALPHRWTAPPQWRIPAATSRSKRRPSLPAVGSVSAARRSARRCIWCCSAGSVPVSRLKSRQDGAVAPVAADSKISKQHL